MLPCVCVSHSLSILITIETAEHSAAMSGLQQADPDCCQVIDSVGAFQEDNLERFVKQHGVLDARTNYQVVAIMGPQSSGKSTLMNHVVSRAC